MDAKHNSPSGNSDLSLRQKQKYRGEQIQRTKHARKMNRLIAKISKKIHIGCVRWIMPKGKLATHAAGNNSAISIVL
jgi:hypothetical protein